MRSSILVALFACGDTLPQETRHTTPQPAPIGAPVSITPTDPAADLKREQDEYVEDIMAFSKTTREQVRERMQKGSAPLKDEWNDWERKGKMTEERIKAFYKQTANYIYELGEWHLFVDDKRKSDLQLVEDMRKHKARNILDFGGGVGMMAFILSRAGFDVTLADLDGTSLDFATFRAKRHSIPIKIWKSDVEPKAPDQKYDVILLLDVLEHLPRNELKSVVDRLIALKHAGTQIVIAAPFGKTAVHPMHLDADAHTYAQTFRLQTELPPPK